MYQITKMDSSTHNVPSHLKITTPKRIDGFLLIVKIGRCHIKLNYSSEYVNERFDVITTKRLCRIPLPKEIDGFIHKCFLDYSILNIRESA